MYSCLSTPSLGAHSPLANLRHFRKLLRNLEMVPCIGLPPMQKEVAYVPASVSMADADEW